MPAAIANPFQRLARPAAGIFLFPVIIAVLLGLVYEGLTIASAVRAYVGGESLWSKGQKAAVQSLYRYAATQDEADYQRYEQALTVPLADHQGRLLLEQPTPDIDGAARWFVLGKNHPADAKNMARLFVRFGQVKYMRRAIQIWTAGDEKIAALEQTASVLHEQIRAGHGSSETTLTLVRRIGALDNDLTVLEADFSATLGQGARWINRVIFAVAVLTGAVLMAIGMWVTSRMLHHERMATETERALRQSEAQLRQAQKMETIGRLAGGVAHDFNNLLTVILGTLDLVLMERAAGGVINPRLLDDARLAAKRAEMLTRQLLTFSRRQVVQPSILQLDSSVSDMHGMLARLIGEDIQLITELDPQTPTIEADPGQIGQVILNLVLNAREAMPYGGTLTIRTGAYDDNGNAMAMLEVEDTGVGMDSATRGHIFEPFFTTKGAGQGTGLGLAVVYGIVSQDGGRIEVESEVGKGTTFRVLLPACRAADVATPASTISVAPRRGHETVLLVEDEDSVRKLARQVLSNQGYTVIDAVNGKEALRILESDSAPLRIDLVMSDLVMPYMGGRELVRAMAQRGMRVPVVFMSGYTNDPSPFEDMRGQRAAFLPKPFTIDGLSTIVRQTLDAQ